QDPDRQAGRKCQVDRGEHAEPGHDGAEDQQDSECLAAALGHVRHRACCGKVRSGIPLRHAHRHRESAVTAVQNAALSQTTFAGDRLRPVRIWLYLIAFMVLCMVMGGGMTRLTGSGLSITTWRPISGIIPPLNEADWLAEFAGYKLIPQFDVYNHWMTLEDFKGIFWWEWIHRFLGRMIGFAFAIPFVVFLVQKRLTRDMAVPLAGLFLLGG